MIINFSIDNLIDKLNDSINQKIYSNDIENGFNAYRKDFNNPATALSRQNYELCTPVKKDKKNNKSKQSYEISSQNDNEDDSKDKSAQYMLSSKFFNECRMVLKGDEYIKLIDSLKIYNSNKATKDVTFRKIEQILNGYDKLQKDFKNIFYSK
jgi:hypothetical protein